MLNLLEVRARGVWINIRGLGTKPARGGGRSPRMDRAQMTLSTSSPSSSPQGLSFTGSQDKQWWENIARATTNTLLCSCYISGLKKCFLIYPQLHFDTLFYFLGPARRTVAVAGGSGHRHQSIIIPAQIGGRQQEKGTIRQLASKPHE